ncbi:MAG: hypothetical protein HY720_26745 [Planctomycetes bacterium]|nr:hypothetical protein [Planctomycetota bacterium]
MRPTGRVAFAVIAVLLVTPAGAQGPSSDNGEEPVAIDLFEHDGLKDGFAFVGRSLGPPDGTLLYACLSLDGQDGPKLQLVVKEGSFEGTFDTAGKRLAPGRYVLTVGLLGAQPSGIAWSWASAHQECPDAARSWECEPSRIEDDRRRRREAIEDEMGRLRDLHERSLAARSGAEDLEWLEPRLSETLGDAGKVFRETWIEPMFLPPFGTAMEAVSSLYRELGTLLGTCRAEADGREPEVSFARVEGRLHGLAWLVRRELGDGSVRSWPHRTRIAREQGEVDRGVYRSRTSGFRIEVPPEYWGCVLGESDSPLRLSMRMTWPDGHAVEFIDVYRHEFAWARDREELLEAWEGVAEGEWPRYRLLEKRKNPDGDLEIHFRTIGPMGYALRLAHVYPSEQPGVVFAVIDYDLYDGLVRFYVLENRRSIAHSFSARP